MCGQVWMPAFAGMTLAYCPATLTQPYTKADLASAK
jgi:hypothetical protein